MHHSAGPVDRFRLFSSFVAAAAIAVVFCPPAHADDELFDPAVPPIVVGGTVDTQATIVVDPQTPASVDSNKPPVVTSGGPRKPECCMKWFPNANPPVVEVERRIIDNRRSAYLDNHGRYWLLIRQQPIVIEQIGGWPAPPPEQTTPTNLPPNVNSLFPDQNATFPGRPYVPPKP